MIGAVGGERPGPTLVVVAGMHGNEPEGVHAAAAVVAELQEKQTSIRGNFAVFRGNLAALREGVRYVDEDLNRGWSWEADHPLRETQSSQNGASEPRERQELLSQLWNYLRKADSDEPILFLDLHTFSAGGPPFSIASDHLANRTFARSFGIPHVLGVMENTEGTILEYMERVCDVAVTFEGGQQGTAEARECHEDLIWVALVRAGMLAPYDCPSYHARTERLRERGRGQPSVSEILWRYNIRAGDGFVMRPGYRNFQTVKRGESLAKNLEGYIEAKGDGFVLMPLYQQQGVDGFYFGYEVSRRRQWLSSMLRRLRMGRSLAVLPGINVHAGEREALVLDKQAQGRFPRAMFELFGYRESWRDGDELVLLHPVQGRDRQEWLRGTAQS